MVSRTRLAWERTCWILAASVLLRGDHCGGSPEDEFRGLVLCGANPVLSVVLKPGACEPIPRCQLPEDPAFFDNNDWTVYSSLTGDLSGAVNAEAQSLPDFKRFPDHGHLRHETSPRRSHRLCVEDTAPAGEVVQGWIAMEARPHHDPAGKIVLVSYDILVGGGTPPPDAGVDDAGVGVDASTPDTGPTTYCGDGLVTPPEACDPAASGPPCTSECTLAPLVGIADAFLSPELPPGVETHFTGVTQFVMAKLTNRAAELRVSCSLSGGDDCDMTFDVSAPSGDSTMSEVALLPSMAEGQYEFSLRADQSGTLSDEVLLTAELRPSVGMLKCEQATDGPFGPTQERWFGLQLVTPDGSRVATADYYMYERTTPGQGWNSATGQFPGQPYLLLFGKKDYIHSGRNFLIIAVDSASGTVEAAREFRWNQEESIPTQGCRVCDMNATGDCRIILP